MKAVCC